MISNITFSCLKDSIQLIYQLNKNKSSTNTNHLQPSNLLKDSVQQTRNIYLKHLNIGCDQEEGLQQSTSVWPTMQQPCNLKPDNNSPYFNRKIF